MAIIIERSRSTIVHAVTEDEIELIHSEEEPPLLLDEHVIDILRRNLEDWYRHRRRSKMPDERTIEIVSTGPTAPTFRDLRQKRRGPSAADDASALRWNTNELRLEMEHLKVLDDPARRLKIEALLQRIEEAIMSILEPTNEIDEGKESRNVAAGDDDGIEESKEIQLDRGFSDESNAVKEPPCYAAADGTEKNKSPHHLTEPAPLDATLLSHYVRRAAVAVAGGAVTIAGVACIPCPVAPGCLVVYLGLMMLATEFESAQRVMDAARVPVDRFLVAVYGGDEDGLLASSEASALKE